MVRTATLAFLLCCLGSPLECGAATSAPAPQFTPGQETRLERKKFGDYLVVYLPQDYTPERRWPVIFCYHGQGGKPTSYPFRQVTGGKGFVIVGMEYLAERRTKETWTARELDRYLAREVESCRAVARLLRRHLRLDPDRFLVGGFSMGGWTASALGEISPQTWAGIVILGAGRQRMFIPGKPPGSLRGKPIFIGCGDKGPNYPHARKAADFYRSLGARVTFETFHGLGHQMKLDSQLLPRWLAANGSPSLAADRQPQAPAHQAPVPHPQPAPDHCRVWLSMARNFIKAGRPDLARPYLERIIKKQPDGQWAAEARKLLEDLR